MTKGDRALGRIVAIRITTEGDEPVRRVDTYAVQLGPDRGGVRVSFRQYLSPDAFVRLGMEVPVRVKDDHAVIDWAEAMAPLGVHGQTLVDTWKAVKDPGFTGIHDSMLGIEREQRKGVPARVTIRSAAMRSAAFGLTTQLAFDSVVEVAGQPAYAVELKKVSAPFYAAHLLVEGLTLPGFVRQGRPDKVTIDWAAAAMQNPGVGVPPSALFQQNSSEGVPMATMGAWGAPGADGGDDSAGAIDFAAAVAGAGGMAAGTTIGGWTVGGAGQADAGSINGVSFELYLVVESAIMKQGIKPKDWDAFAQSYGVPPGTWPTTAQQWGMQVARNPGLAQRYAAAMQ